MFEFLWPWAFVVLVLPLFLYLRLKPLERNELALLVPQVGAYEFSTSSSTSIYSPKNLLTILVILLWLALATALARPQWTGEATPLPTLNRDMVVVLDISGSMASSDMEVDGRDYSRLAVAKYVINSFIEERDGDRIGVVLFGSRPYVYIPLTSDTAAVTEMLQDAPVGIAGRQTAIGDAIGLAVKQLLNHPADHRTVILLTDGNSNAGELNPTDAAELAAASDVRLYTIGLTPRSDLMSFFGSTFNLNRGGLDTEVLKNLAETTQGQFFEANNVQDLQRIYATIDEMEPIEQESKVIRPIRSLFHVPLAIAIALFGLVIYLKFRQDG